MQNARSISENSPFTTPEIDDTDPQRALGLGPGRLHRGAGPVPWHKRLVLTRAPSPAAHHILLVLGSCVSDSATDAWPSVAWLADKSGRSCRVVQRALRELEGVGLLSGETVKGGTTRYRLTADTPDARVTPPLTPASPEGTSEGTKGSKAAAAGTRSTDQAETKQPVADLSPVDRHTCSKCGHSWPKEYGEVCYSATCNQPKGSTSAGLAAPVPGKYDCLWDDAPGPRKGGLQEAYAERLRSARADATSEVIGVSQPTITTDLKDEQNRSPAPIKPNETNGSEPPSEQNSSPAQPPVSGSEAASWSPKRPRQYQRVDGSWSEL